MPDTNKIDITIDDVVSAWDDHYINHGQNMENLHMLPFESFGTMEAGTLIETTNTELREANIEVQEVLQQYQDDFTSKGGTVFTPVSIPLYNMKVDVGVIPHKLIKSWLGFLANTGNDPATYPFIQWLVQDYILKQTDEDLEMKAIYKGVYAAPVEGTAGDAGKVMNGIDKQLNVLEALGAGSGGFDPLTTGNLDEMSAKDFVTAIEEWFKQIPERFRYNEPLPINMNRTFRDKFRQGMHDKYNINYQATEQLTRLMFFENATIVGRASMQGKQRIWATPKRNLLFGVRGFSNKNVFDVQKLDRKVKFLTDFWIGCGFVMPQWIFSNEVASDSVSA
jgi:hypothetical protein